MWYALLMEQYARNSQSDEAPENAGARSASDDAAIAGVTPDEMRFADYLRSGCSQTAAFKLAWPDSGLDGSGLRSAASKKARTRRIRTYLSLREGVDPAAASVVTPDERRRLLSQVAKSKDPNARIKAVAELNKMDAAARAERQRENGPPDPIARLRELLRAAPELAVALARHLGLTLSPPSREEWSQRYDELFSEQKPLARSHKPPKFDDSSEGRRAAFVYEVNTRRPEDDKPLLPDGWAKSETNTTLDIMPDSIERSAHGGPGELNPFVERTATRRSRL